MPLDAPPAGVDAPGSTCTVTITSSTATTTLACSVFIYDSSGFWTLVLDTCVAGGCPQTAGATINHMGTPATGSFPFNPGAVPGLSGGHVSYVDGATTWDTYRSDLMTVTYTAVASRGRDTHGSVVGPLTNMSGPAPSTVQFDAEF